MRDSLSVIRLSQYRPQEVVIGLNAREAEGGKSQIRVDRNREMVAAWWQA